MVCGVVEEGAGVDAVALAPGGGPGRGAVGGGVVDVGVAEGLLLVVAPAEPAAVGGGGGPGRVGVGVVHLQA